MKGELKISLCQHEKLQIQGLCCWNQDLIVFLVIRIDVLISQFILEFSLQVLYLYVHNFSVS